MAVNEDISTNRLLAYFFIARMRTRMRVGMTRDEAWMDALKSYMPVLVRPKRTAKKPTPKRKRAR